MKIRSGFVSNSSSSSFVLKVGEPFDTVKEVASYMIPKRNWDTDQDLLEKLYKCPDDKNLAFKSCNYDTFIAMIDGYFLIQTSHNHYWDLHDFNAKSYPHEFLDVYGDDSFYNLPHIVQFYSIEHGIEGKVASYKENNKFCDKCHDDFWIINNVKICLNCKNRTGQI